MKTYTPLREHLEATSVQLEERSISTASAALEIHSPKEGSSCGEKGTGLGLLLCKEFVEKNKGTISVTSTLEKGSSFRITLPVKE